MMHRCSSSCSCGLYNQSTMFYSMPSSYDQNQYYYNNNEESASAADYYYDQSMYSSSSSSVDCTLSLGPPSTGRHTNNVNERPQCETRRSLSSSGHKSGRASASDPLVARRCANCDTTSTPLWRNGPRGPKSLCNACGIRYKKEERRAAAAAAASNNAGAAGGMDVMHNSWVQHTQMQMQIPYTNYSSSAYANEYAYMEDDDRDSAFLSWRLNVHCS